ncbi:unnamed protein product [Effrenium voratum]|nr:unnamed protein product [Effrenium voratum]
MAKVRKVGREVPVTASVERFEVVDAGSGQDVLSKGLDAVKARVSLVKTGQHVDYIVRVFFDGQSWTVTRRYNEFAALADILKKKLASVPAIPQKSMVRQFAPEYLEARKNGLNVFIKELCRRRDAANCREVQDFLLLRQRVPHLSQADASEPVQSAEVQEASFGIAHFEYDPVQGLLLLGSSDFSWASRMDTKITNIKMPWEKKAPNLPSAQLSLSWFQDYVSGNDAGWSRMARAGVLLAATGVLAAAAWAFCLAESQEEELLEKVLKELRLRLFQIARDVAAIAKDVRQQLEAQGIQVDDTQLRSAHDIPRQTHFEPRRSSVTRSWAVVLLPLQHSSGYYSAGVPHFLLRLSTQQDKSWRKSAGRSVAIAMMHRSDPCGILRSGRISERFEKVQAEVLASFGCSSDTLATITEESAEVVRMHAEGVRQMMKDALGGVPPMLPGIELPAELSQERLLKLHGEIHDLKIEKARKLAAQTRSKRFAKQELASAVALLSQAAEEEVLRAHSELGEKGEVYHSAMAFHHQSPPFQEKLGKLHEEHRKQLIAAFQEQWQQSPAELKFHMQGMNRFTALITCVLMANCRDKASCLAGLSDGTIGVLPMKSERGATGGAGQVLPLVRHTAGVVALALDETEQWLFSASSDKAIIVFDLKRQMIQCEVEASLPADECEEDIAGCALSALQLKTQKDPTSSFSVTLATEDAHGHVTIPQTDGALNQANARRERGTTGEAASTGSLSAACCRCSSGEVGFSGTGSCNFCSGDVQQKQAAPEECSSLLLAQTPSASRSCAQKCGQQFRRKSWYPKSP